MTTMPLCLRMRIKLDWLYIRALDAVGTSNWYCNVSQVFGAVPYDDTSKVTELFVELLVSLFSRYRSVE